MFREEFNPNSLNKDNMPMHYHIILLPTRDNYFNFINTLEKLVINNIQRQTFIDSGPLIKGVDGKTIEGYYKGTLVLLSGWFAQNNNSRTVEEAIITPLKKLRKLRQKPAHELYSNAYDEQIWSDQKELMHLIYSALRGIRLLLANHPLCKDVKIPKKLYEGTNIVQY